MRTWLSSGLFIVLIFQAIALEMISAAPSGPRIEEGLVVFYPLNEGQGDIVHDQSQQGSPMDLAISGTASWIEGENGVLIRGGKVGTIGRATKLIQALQTTGQSTVEVWFEPANLSQSGPARLVSIGNDSVNQNFVLGQIGDDIEARLLHTGKDGNSHPRLTTGNNFLTTGLTQLVHTFDGTVERLYVNGVEHPATVSSIGSYQNWDIHDRLNIGNEGSYDRPWEGIVRLAAVYDRTLTSEEINQNFSAGLPVGDPPPGTGVEDYDPVTVLATDGKHFTLNGETTFLHGISYYAALGASQDFIQGDLNDMQALGINWIRVWATWQRFNDDSAIDAQGFSREEYMEKLKWLVEECDRRGMVVDVTLYRLMHPALHIFQVHRQAIESLLLELRSYRNWYLDIANERNDTDGPNFVEIGRLRDFVKFLDSERRVTASHAFDISDQDLRDYLITGNVDFITPHRPRDAESPQETKSFTEHYLTQIQAELGRLVPVHYQEPFRRGFGMWQAEAEDYLTDLRGAFEGGAAGWCFHNGDQRFPESPENRPRRSFDLHDFRLFDQLDDVELLALDNLHQFLSGGDSTSPSEPAPAVTLSAEPSTIKEGESSLLSWSSSDATSCSASGSWSGSKDVSGSESVSPTATTNYNLSCTGPGGSADASVIVTVDLTDFDFSLSNGGDVSVTAGASIDNSIAATLVSGTSEEVSFSISSGLPGAATASFNPAVCTPNCQTSLTISTSSSTPTGTFSIAVTGTAGDLARQTLFDLTVTSDQTSSDDGSTATEGLIAHWSFDEGSGTVAGDSAGNNPGTLRNMDQGWVTGQTGAALAFDGVNDYIDVGDPADGSLDLGSGDFTLAAWVKVDPSMHPFGTIIFKGAISDGNPGYWFWINPSTGQPILYLGNGSSRVTSFAGATNLKDGIWHHVVMVASRSSGAGITYIDGVQDDVDWIGYVGGSINTSQPLSMGSRSGADSQFQGLLDDIRIYSRVVTDSEVQSLAGLTPPSSSEPAPFDFSLSNGGNISVTAGASVGNSITAALVSGTSETVSFSVSSGLPSGATASFDPAGCNPSCEATLTILTSSTTPTGTFTIAVSGTAGDLTRQTTFDMTVASDETSSGGTGSTPTEGLIAHWSFNEGSGTEAGDSEGNNPGALRNMEEGDWVAGQTGTALSFDGVDDYVDVGDPADGSLDLGSGDFTLAAWVKVDPNMHPFGTIIFKGAISDGHPGYWFWINPSTGRPTLYFGNGNSRVTSFLGITNVKDGTWHHVVMVASRSSGLGITYLDGIQDDTDSISYVSGSINSRRSLSLGARAASPVDSQFTGVLDDIQIFNRALSDSEVQELFTVAP